MATEAHLVVVLSFVFTDGGGLCLVHPLDKGVELDGVGLDDAAQASQADVIVEEVGGGGPRAVGDAVFTDLGGELIVEGYAEHGHIHPDVVAAEGGPLTQVGVKVVGVGVGNADARLDIGAAGSGADHVKANSVIQIRRLAFALLAEVEAVSVDQPSAGIAGDFHARLDGSCGSRGSNTAGQQQGSACNEYFLHVFLLCIGDGLRVSRANKKPFGRISGACRVKRAARTVKFFLPR